MRNIIKLAIIVGILLQLGGHPVKSKVISYCPAGFPNVFKGYKFGWPIPVITFVQIWGCTTIPNQWVEFFWPGIIGTSVFWITVFWILEFYWPYEGCLGEWEVECDQYPCSDKERCRKIASRRR